MFFDDPSVALSAEIYGNAVLESAQEIGGKAPKKTAINLIIKQQKGNKNNTRQNETVELSKAISKRKTNDI